MGMYLAPLGFLSCRIIPDPSFTFSLELAAVYLIGSLVNREADGRDRQQCDRSYQTITYCFYQGSSTHSYYLTSRYGLH